MQTQTPSTAICTAPLPVLHTLDRPRLPIFTCMSLRLAKIIEMPTGTSRPRRLFQSYK